MLSYKPCVRIFLFSIIFSFLITCIACAFIPGTASALNPMDIYWRILKTPNFEIYFHNRDDAFAKSAGKIAEKAFAEIGKDLKIGKLDRRIPLVLHDFSDASYGFTNILQNKVWVSIAQPEDTEQSDRTWIESVIRHELTHYLMGTKFDKKLKLGTGRIFGWGILPMWFIEGVAQREESSWNAVKDSAVRTALLSKKFFDLKELQIFYFFNYHGRRLGYHIGNSIVNFMAKKFGPECIPDILANVNFTINGFNRAVKKVTKKSMSEIFQMWQEENTKAYEERVMGKKCVCESAKPLSDHNGLNVSPHFEEGSGFIYYLSNQGRDARRLSLYHRDPKNGFQKMLIENIEDNYYITSDKKTIYFCRKTRDPFDSVISDIYTYDAAHGMVNRLTNWLHVENPVFFEPAGELYAVVNESGTMNVCRIDKKGEIAEKLTDLKYDSAIYNLQTTNGPGTQNELFFNYFHDGKFSIAFVNRERGSKYYKKLNIVVTSPTMILNPRIIAMGEGKFRAYFIREDEGLLNIHSVDFWISRGRVQTSGCVPITDFRESVLDFDVDDRNGRLVVVTPTASGSQITVLDSFPAVAKTGCAPDKETANATAPTQAAPAGNISGISPFFTFEKFKEGTAAGSPGTDEYRDFKISDYKSKPRLEYLIPMIGSQSSKSLYGVQGRVADPTNRHIMDFQTLIGTGKYRNLNGIYTYRGFKPTIGISVYDVVRDLRPGVLENVKGTDLFLSYRAFDSSLTLNIFDRIISSNSISPLLELRNPTLYKGEKKDRGYSLRFVNSEADNTVDADIHPISAHYFVAYHQNSTGSMNSFFQYKINKLDLTKWILLDEKKNTTLKIRIAGGVASGNYDFQIGGYNDLRGYSTTTLLGKYMQLYSLEYSGTPILEPVKFRALSINKIYPAVFYDLGAAYFDNTPKNWRRSAGIELRMRLLLFRKTPIVGRTGVAQRLSGERIREVYTTFEMKF